MSRFEEYIQGVGVQPATPMMPLTHVCQEYFFREILATKQLKPSSCQVFSEELLYFFYGKPAYTPKTDGVAVDASGLAPVCLVCKPHLVFDLVVKVYGAGYQIMTIVLHDGFLGFVRFQIPERKKLSQRSHGPWRSHRAALLIVLCGFEFH